MKPSDQCPFGLVTSKRFAAIPQRLTYGQTDGIALSLSRSVQLCLRQRNKMFSLSITFDVIAESLYKRLKLTYLQYLIIWVQSINRTGCRSRSREASEACNFYSIWCVRSTGVTGDRANCACTAQNAIERPHNSESVWGRVIATGTSGELGRGVVCRL